MTGTSGMGCLEPPICLHRQCQSCISFIMLLTYMCIVTPIARKSLTRITLLITSRPRSSKTRTFQMGLPSASRMGATGASRPLACASSASEDSTVSFKLSIFLSDANEDISEWLRSPYMTEQTYLAIAKRIAFCRHFGDDVGVKGRVGCEVQKIGLAGLLRSS
jgi:hypothetical protein